MNKNILAAISISLISNLAFGGNDKPTRTQSCSGAFICTTTTESRKYYNNATAQVQQVIDNSGKITTPTAISLAGHWETTTEAAAAYKAQYDHSPYSIVSEISYGMGDYENTSGPNDVFKEESERSIAKTNVKRAENTSSNPPWTLTAWIGTDPPKCETKGNSSSSTKDVGNAKTETKITNYSWTASWTETEQ